jgi:hypothetical protein
MASPACPSAVGDPLGEPVGELVVVGGMGVSVTVGAAVVAVGVGEPQKSEKMLSSVTGPPA